MALPQLRPLVPATLLGDRGNPVSRDVIRPAAPATGAQDAANVTAPARLEDANPMESLANRAAEALAGASAQDVVRWAADTFGDRMCITSSMTDAVIVHLVSQVRPGVDVVFLDTGYHFAETIGTRDAVSAVYPVNVINVTPAQTVAEQDEQMGPRLYSRNPDLCCYLRKVVPLEHALEPYDAWVSGVRREETHSRSDSRVVQWDARREMVKVNPIVDWTQEQLDAYIADNGILVNPLVYDGYPSIGCATCTARVEAGADARSGRWAGTGKTECGIHL
jgi:phosphoadenosine phosphosulfate reductase